ncbi:MAG: tyrosine-type recombinase/integrase [Anaerolineae bacterium]|nr:tyrosine-type recombinase/integrase [Anaerolineae bacterium]
MSSQSATTISEAIADFLALIASSRSDNTARSYKNALNAFAILLEANALPPEKTPIAELGAEPIAWFLTELRGFAPASEQMYIVAVSRFYQYLVAEELSGVNLERLRLLVKTRARKPGKRLPQFPREEIEKLINYAAHLHEMFVDEDTLRLINYRDRAFILTLADTGMRVSEATGLRRGDMDWNEARGIIIGKGDQEAVVRFSSRALEAIKVYLRLRGEMGYQFNGPVSSMPVFARHDRGAGSKVKPISSSTGRSIIKQRVLECLGEASLGTITPHSFRHFFVTTVLRASSGNLKLAQELARHKNIQVTQRYAHLSDDELDRGYFEIFEKP